MKYVHISNLRIFLAERFLKACEVVTCDQIYLFLKALEVFKAKDLFLRTTYIEDV